MKNVKIFLTGFLFLTFAACSLEENIIDTPTPSLVKTEDDIKPMLRGLYSYLNDGDAFKYRGWLLLTLAADDFYSESGAEFGPIANREYTSVNVAGFYNRLFMSVGTANEVIDVLDKIGGNLDEAFVNQAYGEAHFIRAFSYYYLVRLYGGVPLRLEPTNVNSNLYMKRASIDEVYTQIFSDFRAASSRLPLANQVPAQDLGRATKGAAQALLSQAYLTYGNQLSLRGDNPDGLYRSAVTYADSVISSNQYQLLNNYADLFDLSKEAAAYKEVIFGIRFQPDLQRSLYPSAGSEFAFNFSPPNTHLVNGNPSFGAGNGGAKVMPWIADFYRSPASGFANATGTVIDYRNEVSFFQTWLNTTTNVNQTIYPNIPPPNGRTIQAPHLRKYIDPNGRDQRNNGNDFFVIRLAEIYLIKAEALNELNDMNTAFVALNQVRTRARNANGTARTIPANINAVNNPGINKQQLRMKIFQERGLELIGEGQRWFDLVRMQHPDNPAKTMYEYQLLEELKKNTYPKVLPVYQPAQSKYSNSFAVYAKALNVTVPKFLLFPIPLEETASNPNFGEQNTGW